ncbi:hypothetical protein NVP2117O_75 [Vibrio phage 2.117.O._10N.261.45.E9]|nr:hypothetical protein NVP1117O_75 [Vibrio phage 1.117.O._10N.261.45.E9]AUR95476.1 hypothetical protein NVP1207B_69 [Vibrio phage 1.207.B._10N.222.51.C2]AUS02367.1 hypothetical protein NVP2117O_75 [Vibrio phage 2.117.O._10N.261.45.E9]
MNELRFHPWFRLPQEMRDLDQWVAFKIVDRDGRSVKIPIDPNTGNPAKVDDPKTWGSFAQAATCGHEHIGFAFTHDDPFIFIDLDTGKAPAEVQALHHMLVDQAGSYAETSVSGNGYHIITEGQIPFDGTNDHRVGIEIYRSGRFALMTGSQVHWETICPQQELINLILQHMPNRQDLSYAELISTDATLTDEEIIDQASKATNGTKFWDLWQGNWQKYTELNNDHSTADLSLLTFLDFYTKDVEQVVRLFMQSALYRPEKGRRDGDGSDYIVRSLRIARTRNEADAPSPLDVEDGKRQAETLLAAKTPPPTTTQPKNTEYTFPAGLIGDIAEDILASSIRPVPEIALAGALALVAGLAGRQFNTTTSTGLNLYLIMLAETGRGKEGASSGIDRILSAVRSKIPMIEEYRGPASIRSGQALAKFIPDNPCFCSVIGEVGYMFQNLGSSRANSADIELRRQLLDLYGKSGWHQTARSSIYSDKDKNAEAVKAPALTLLGEGTQGSVLDNLDEQMVLDGLLPRFCFIEYAGKRPPRNTNMRMTVPERLVQRVADFAETCIAMRANETCAIVRQDPMATQILDDYDLECDKIMNSGKGATIELANRAHLQALRLSSLVAVSVNWAAPVVTAEMATWAVDFVRRSNRVILSRFEAGEIGNGDSRMVAEIKQAVEDYLTYSPTQRKNYGNPLVMSEQPIIAYKFFYTRLRNRPIFKDHRLGAGEAIKKTLRLMCEMGELDEMPLKQAQDMFGRRVSSSPYMVGNEYSKR